MSTVYILGAGASAGYDRSARGLKCPSAGNFFSVAAGVLRSENGDADHHYDSLFYFLKKYYHLSPEGLEKAGLDMQDVLTFLDLELEYSDSEEEMGLLGRARRQFIDLLTATFGRVLEGPPCPYHGAVASSLRAGDTVISFNYDLIMDWAMALYCPYWEDRTGYGFQSSPGEEALGGQAGKSPRVLLLKPHGSFNWVACKTCGRLYALTLNQPGHLPSCFSPGSLLPEPPGHLLEMLIIPPSLHKNIHGRVMQQIWASAHLALEEASRVVIIGYSLPATDFLVKRLFYRALPANRNLQEVELVDRNNRPGKETPLAKKYQSLLCGRGSRVRFIARRKNIGEYAQFLSEMTLKK